MKCVSSVVNTLENITLDPQAPLEEADDSEEALTLIHTAVPLEVAGRLPRLGELRTYHLDEERVKIRDEYDIFHVPGYTLTCTIAAKHVIPASTIDPSKAINNKSYRIPETHRQIEQTLDIIQASKIPCNCPILVFPRKQMIPVSRSGGSW
jgi:hypothetical protein